MVGLSRKDYFGQASAFRLHANRDIQSGIFPLLSNAELAASLQRQPASTRRSRAFIPAGAESENETATEPAEA